MFTIFDQIKVLEVQNRGTITAAANKISRLHLIPTLIHAHSIISDEAAGRPIASGSQARDRPALPPNVEIMLATEKL